jgi:hypothetical protein
MAATLAVATAVMPVIGGWRLAVVVALAVWGLGVRGHDRGHADVGVHRGPPGPLVRLSVVSRGISSRRGARRSAGHDTTEQWPHLRAPGSAELSHDRYDQLYLNLTFRHFGRTS